MAYISYDGLRCACNILFVYLFEKPLNKIRDRFMPTQKVELVGDLADGLEIKYDANKKLPWNIKVDKIKRPFDGSPEIHEDVFYEFSGIVRNGKFLYKHIGQNIH